GPNSAAPKIINPAHKPANQQRRSPGVHPNTVSYRVHQAEELLGRTIDIGALDLSVALTLLPAMRAMTQRSGGEL
ncbi:helix-turn-helix domain-containing protein, partial [Mycobacterium ulcerans]|nr:helix-turn-helix domain-containing protein [Mycobacterium ulcerans]